MIKGFDHREINSMNIWKFFNFDHNISDVIHVSIVTWVGSLAAPNTFLNSRVLTTGHFAFENQWILMKPLKFQIFISTPKKAKWTSMKF